MAEVGDPTRTGPNQDWNNPAWLKSLRYWAHAASVDVGNLVPEWPDPAIDIEIFLKKYNGDTDVYTNDEIITDEIWQDTMVNTYVYLPEIFRGYYSGLTDLVDSLEDQDGNWVWTSTTGAAQINEYVDNWPPYSNCTITGVDYDLTYDFNGGNAQMSRYYLDNVLGFEIHWPVDAPEYTPISSWSGGNWPVRYNNGTIPQLVYGFYDLATLPAWSSGTPTALSDYVSEGTYYVGIHKTNVQWDAPGEPDINDWRFGSHTACGRLWNGGWMAPNSHDTDYGAYDHDFNFQIYDELLDNDTEQVQEVTYEVSLKINAAGGAGIVTTAGYSSRAVCHGLIEVDYDGWSVGAEVHGYHQRRVDIHVDTTGFYPYQVEKRTWTDGSISYQYSAASPESYSETLVISGSFFVPPNSWSPWIWGGMPEFTIQASAGYTAWFYGDWYDIGKPTNATVQYSHFWGAAPSYDLTMTFNGKTITRTFAPVPTP